MAIVKGTKIILGTYMDDQNDAMEILSFGAEHMYPAARAYRKDVHGYHMDKVKAIPDVQNYLEKHHKLKWMRSGFNPAIKCDYITNNIAEVFNNWIKDIKDCLFMSLLIRLGSR